MCFCLCLLLFVWFDCDLDLGFLLLFFYSTLTNHLVKSNEIVFTVIIVSAIKQLKLLHYNSLQYGFILAIWENNRLDLKIATQKWSDLVCADFKRFAITQLNNNWWKYANDTCYLFHIFSSNPKPYLMSVRKLRGWDVPNVELIQFDQILLAIRISHFFLLHQLRWLNVNCSEEIGSNQIQCTKYMCPEYSIALLGTMLPKIKRMQQQQQWRIYTIAAPISWYAEKNELRDHDEIAAINNHLVTFSAELWREIIAWELLEKVRAKYNL